MKAKVRLENVDRMEATLTVTASIGQFKKVKEALDRGIEENYHADADRFSRVVRNSIQKAEASFDSETDA